MREVIGPCTFWWTNKRGPASPKFRIGLRWRARTHGVLKGAYPSLTVVYRGLPGIWGFGGVFRGFPPGPGKRAVFDPSRRGSKLAIFGVFGHLARFKPKCLKTARKPFFGFFRVFWPSGGVLRGWATWRWGFGHLGWGFGGQKGGVFFTPPRSAPGALREKIMKDLYSLDQRNKLGVI